MKMLSAALVASQVLLAAGCRPAPCDEGCRPVERYQLEIRSASGQCTRFGQVLSLPLTITSCDVIDPNMEPSYSGSCIAGKNNDALCTGAGQCLKYMAVRAIKYVCECTLTKAPTPAPTPVPQLSLMCDGDENCPVGEFCRAQKGEQFGCSTKTECVPYAQLGEECGGRRLPCYEERCAGGLRCEGPGLPVDRPGKCARTIRCVEKPSCPRGSLPFDQCTRKQFALRQCVKVTKCGFEQACLVVKP